MVGQGKSKNKEMMSKLAKRLLDRGLDTGEDLRWTGVPSRFPPISGIDGCLSFFALLYVAGLGFLLYLFFSVGTAWIYHAVILVFLSFGLYVAVGRYVQQAIRLRKTYYGLTDKRIIIISGGRTERSRSLPLRDVGDIEVDEWPDGSGTIVFGNLDDTIYEAWGEQITKSVMPWMNTVIPPRLEHIQNVREVAEMIRNTNAVDTQ
jgi:hypothetical protein